MTVRQSKNQDLRLPYLSRYDPLKRKSKQNLVLKVI
jgi:hypothetical protein